MNDFTRYLAEGIENFLDLLDGPYDTKETCLQCYLSSFLTKKFEIKQEKWFSLDQDVGCFSCNNPNKLLLKDKFNKEKKRIRIDLMISQKYLLELKVIKYDELKKSHCYPYIYGNSENELYFDIKVIRNFIKEKKKLDRNPEIKSIMKYNDKDYLTFFHEGQIWYDLIKLLAIRKLKQNHDYEIYLAGIIKNYKADSDDKYFDDSDKIKAKLEFLIKHATENKQEISILHYFKKKQNNLEIRWLRTSINKLSLKVEVFPNCANTWYGYYIMEKS